MPDMPLSTSGDEPTPPPPEEPRPQPTRVELAVAAHSVVIEAPEPLAVVKAVALELFNATGDTAKTSQVGFGTDGGSTELSDGATEGNELILRR